MHEIFSGTMEEMIGNLGNFNQVIIFVISLAIAKLETKQFRVYCIFLLVLLIINEIRLQNNKTYKLNILNPDGLNEAIIIETKLGYKSFLF